jgi:hypothetical protein
MEAGGDRQVRHGRFEHAARMIVEQHFPATRHTRKGEHLVHRAPRHRARSNHPPLAIHRRHERHLTPPGRGNLFGEGKPDIWEDAGGVSHQPSAFSHQRTAMRESVGKITL